MGRRYSRTAAGGARIRGIPRVGSGGRPPGPAAWRGLSCRAPAGPGSGTGVPVRRVRAPGGGAPPEGPDRPAGSRAPRGVLQVESGLEAAIRHDPAGSGCPPPCGVTDVSATTPDHGPSRMPEPPRPWYLAALPRPAGTDMRETPRRRHLSTDPAPCLPRTLAHTRRSAAWITPGIHGACTDNLDVIQSRDCHNLPFCDQIPDRVI